MEQEGALVLDWIDGLAICEDKYGDLLFAEIPEEFVNPGEGIFLEDLQPISLLSEEMQETIKTAIKELPPDYLDAIRPPIPQL